MGYTHYFTTKDALDTDKFKAYSDDMNTIIKGIGTPIAWECDVDEPPEVTPDLVRFNGVGDDGHETFLLSKSQVGFKFCKTACKPYDLVVVAALAVAKDIFKDDIDIGSDGNVSEWVNGVKFASDLLGRTINNPMEYR